MTSRQLSAPVLQNMVRPATPTPDGFTAAIQNKATLLEEGYRAGKTAATETLRPYGLLFAGMGFSGFTADLVRDAATRALDIPFSVVKHYQFPHHVKPGWHTLAISYSGDTEETLSVARASQKQGVPVTAFTTGGKIAEVAQKVVKQPKGYQPRAAFGFTWFSMLGYLEGSGLLDRRVPLAEVLDAVRAVDATCGPDAPAEENEARKLAEVLAGPIPKIYTTPSFYGVGQHFRGMLNENAKKIADLDLVPECNHNDLSGFGGDAANRAHFTVLCLSHADQNPELRKRLDFMEDRYKAWGVPWYNRVSRGIRGFSDHVIEQARAIQFLDYTSLYVAGLRGQDPSDIREIKALKAYIRNGHGTPQPGTAGVPAPKP